MPLEEIFFFVIQSVLTAHLVMLLSAGTLSHMLLDAAAGRKSVGWRLARWGPVPILLTLLPIGFVRAQPATHLFYLSAIVAWVAPVLALLWTLGGDHILVRWRVALASVAVPTLYLCAADIHALRRGTWHITEATSTGVFVWPDLPLEEALFFLVTNCMLVFGMLTFEKAFARLDTFPEVDVAARGHRLMRLLRALALSIDRLPPTKRTRIAALRQTGAILREHSRSFHAAAYAFPPAVRRDLLTLYGFCRVTDNLIDDAPDRERARAHLEAAKAWLDLVYASDTKRPAMFTLVAWLRRRAESGDVPEAVAPSFLLLATLVGRIPRGPIDALLDGYAHDVEARPVRNVDDLVRYSRGVAGGVAEACVWAMWAAEGGPADEARRADILGRANDMGVALQIVNIARDLRDDGRNGRVYVPADWLTAEQRERLLAPDRQPDFAFAVPLLERLLALAADYRARSLDAIEALPASCRGGVRAATEAYVEIGRELERVALKSPASAAAFDGHRVVPSRAWRFVVVLAEFYGLRTLLAPLRPSVSLFGSAQRRAK